MCTLVRLLPTVRTYLKGPIQHLLNSFHNLSGVSPRLQRISQIGLSANSDRRSQNPFRPTVGAYTDTRQYHSPTFGYFHIRFPSPNISLISTSQFGNPAGVAFSGAPRSDREMRKTLRSRSAEGEDVVPRPRGSDRAACLGRWTAAATVAAAAATPPAGWSRPARPRRAVNMAVSAANAP